MSSQLYLERKRKKGKETHRGGKKEEKYDIVCRGEQTQMMGLREKRKKAGLLGILHIYQFLGSPTYIFCL